MADFEWKAIYKDGTELKQFEKDGKEHLFKEININELEKFIVSKDDFKYKANLVKGTIVANDVRIAKNCVGELVCFKRVKAYFGVDIKISEKCTNFHLGIGDKKIIINYDGTYECVGFIPTQEQE